MATRSLIGYYNQEDGSITTTYVHYDGYVASVGAVLNECYKSNTQAKAITNVGYISSLSSDIGDSVSSAVNTEPTEHYHSVEDYLKFGLDGGIEYVYLWDGEAWFVAASDERKFTDVRTVLDDMKAIEKKFQKGLKKGLQSF